LPKTVVKEGRKDGDVKKGWKEDRKEGRIVVSRKVKEGR
jgi:hypothetical protein